jgi:Tol biopolymer transport system component
MERRITASAITAHWAARVAWALLLGLLLGTCGCGGSPRIVVVSPQGNIVFTSSRALNGSDAANAATNIWLTDSTGTSPRPLAGLINASSASPAWSPNGAKIAFESFRALDGGSIGIPAANVWVMNADGSNVIPLTRLTADLISSIHSAWSPDGTRIAYDSTRVLDGRNIAAGNVNIWVMNADGTNATPLTTLRASLASSVSPVWSPDGAKIAFTSSRALSGFDDAILTRNIWVMNSDGSGAQPLTKLTVAASSAPVWSPDGTRIAYVSARALDGSNNAGSPKAPAPGLSPYSHRLLT